MKEPFKFIFGDYLEMIKYLGLTIGLGALIMDSYILLITAFGIMAIGMFIRLLINVMKYFTILKFSREEK